MNKYLFFIVVAASLFFGQANAQEWVPYRYFALSLTQHQGQGPAIGEVYIEVLDTGFPNVRAFVRWYDKNKISKGYQLDVLSNEWNGNVLRNLNLSFDPTKFEGVHGFPIEIGLNYVDAFSSPEGAIFDFEGIPQEVKFGKLPMSETGKSVTSKSMLRKFDVRKVESPILTPKWRDGANQKNLVALAGIPDGNHRIYGVLIAVHPEDSQRPEVIEVVQGSPQPPIVVTSVVTSFNPKTSEARIVEIEGTRTVRGKIRKVHINVGNDEVTVSTWVDYRDVGEPASVLRMKRDKTVVRYEDARKKLDLPPVRRLIMGGKRKSEARNIERARKFKSVGRKI